MVIVGDWNKVGGQHTKKSFSDVLRSKWVLGMPEPDFSGEARDFIISTRCVHDEVTLPSPIAAADGTHNAVLVRLTPLASPQGKPEPPEFSTFVENTVNFIRKYQELPVTESTSVIHKALDILTMKALERPSLHDMQELAERWVVLTNKMKETLELKNLKRTATVEAELKTLKRLRTAAEESIQKSFP